MKASVLELQIKELPLFKRGKVREVYDLGENLLLFSTDRISAFDHVLPVGIPNKGCILNSISSYWFKKTKHIVPNHFITDQVKDYPKVLTPYLEILDGRSMIVKKAQLIEIECVVRGYLAGSAWKEYREKRTIAGEKQPAGLGESAKLIKPLFTPAIKASFGHDENISVLEMMRIVGEDIGLDLAKYSLALYQFASESALLQGLILADTKFEFGIDKDGNIILIDELLTPDSSRYWRFQDYKPGQSQPGFDKQIVRDYLESLGWDKKPPAPLLPENIIQLTSEKYEELLRSLTQEAVLHGSLDT